MIQVAQQRLPDKRQHSSPSFRREVIVIDVVTDTIIASIMNMYITLLELNVKKTVVIRNPL